MARLTRRTFAIQSDVSEKIDALVDGHTLEANLLVDKALRRYLEWEMELGRKYQRAD